MFLNARRLNLFPTNLLLQKSKVHSQCLPASASSIQMDFAAFWGNLHVNNLTKPQIPMEVFEFQGIIRLSF